MPVALDRLRRFRLRELRRDGGRGRARCGEAEDAAQETFVLAYRSLGTYRADGPTGAWLARIGAGRRTSALVGDEPDDDVADPVGRSRAVYEDTADELEYLLRRLVEMLAGSARPATGAPATTDYTRS